MGCIITLLGYLISLFGAYVAVYEPYNMGWIERLLGVLLVYPGFPLMMSLSKLFPGPEGGAPPDKGFDRSITPRKPPDMWK